MNRRTFLTAAVVLFPLTALAACGDDATGNRPDPDRTDPTTVPPTTALPTTTAPGIAHPTGKDEVVLRLGWDGGFVAPGTIFGRLPTLLIAGDRSVYVQGAQIEIYPQPLLPPVLVGTITEAKLQEVLEAAKAANLFRTITYAQPTLGIADAPDTTLTIVADGVTYTHTAYALGMGEPESDADRKAFADFVGTLDPLAIGVPDSKPFAPERYAIKAVPAEGMTPPDGITPGEVDWPATAGVKLADASECGVVTTAAVGTVLAAANTETRFVEGGVKYVLYVRPLLPGDAGC